MPEQPRGFDDYRQRDKYRQAQRDYERRNAVLEALRHAGYTVRATPEWTRQIVRIW